MLPALPQVTVTPVEQDPAAEVLCFGESSDLSWLLICNRLCVHAVVSVYEHSAALSSANSIHQLLDRLGE